MARPKAPAMGIDSPSLEDDHNVIFVVERRLYTAPPISA
jgi:hypothetical protein